MADFLISENERAGIEKAAQWHDWQADIAHRYWTRDDVMARIIGQSEWLAEKAHRECARLLRDMLEPRSSGAGIRIVEADRPE